MQKRAYRLVAYICAHRPDFTDEHMPEVLERLVAVLPSAMSAAKQYRLACLHAVIMTLLHHKAQDLNLAALPGLADTPQSEQQRQACLRSFQQSLPSYGHVPMHL